MRSLFPTTEKKMRREILPRIPSIDEIEELVRDDAQERDYLIRHETDDVLHLRHHRHPKLHKFEAENRGGIFSTNLFVEVERELEQDEEEELQHEAADEKLEDGVLPLEALAEAPENNSSSGGATLIPEFSRDVAHASWFSTPAKIWSLGPF